MYPSPEYRQARRSSYDFYGGARPRSLDRRRFARAYGRLGEGGSAVASSTPVPRPAPALEAPAVQAADDPYSQLMAGVQRGPGMGAARTRRALLQMQAGNAARANPLLWDTVSQLQRRAATFDPASVAADHAGELEAVDDLQRRAEGTLTRDLAARGLDDSSAMATGLGALRAGGAASKAQLIRGVYGQERQRQELASAQLRDLLAGLLGRSTGQAASLADSIRHDRMAQQQMDAQSGFDVLGTLFGVGGASWAAAASACSPGGPCSAPFHTGRPPVRRAAFSVRQLCRSISDPTSAAGAEAAP